MAIAQGTGLKCVVTLTLPANVIAQNIFYFQVIGINPIDEAAALTTIASAMNAIYATIEDYVVSTATLDTVKVHEWDWDPVEGWETGTYIGEAALADNFAGVGDMLPHAVAATITGKTPNVKTRSRKSFAGLTEASSSGSTLAGPVITALVAAAVQWLLTRTIIGSDALDPVVPDKYGEFAALIVALVSEILGSQRQRKPGIGV